MQGRQKVLLFFICLDIQIDGSKKTIGFTSSNKISFYIFQSLEDYEMEKTVIFLRCPNPDSQKKPKSGRKFDTSPYSKS